MHIFVGEEKRPDFIWNHSRFHFLAPYRSSRKSSWLSKCVIVIFNRQTKGFCFRIWVITHKWTIRALFWTGRQASWSGTFIMCSADINSTWICQWSSSKGLICTIFHSRNIRLFEKFFSFSFHWSSLSL